MSLLLLPSEGADVAQSEQRRDLFEANCHEAVQRASLAFVKGNGVLTAFIHILLSAVFGSSLLASLEELDSENDLSGSRRAGFVSVRASDPLYAKAAETLFALRDVVQAQNTVHIHVHP